MASTLDRIKEYIDFKGLNVSSFEKKTGFSNGAFSVQLKKGKTIGVDKLENILNTFSDLSSEWLLTGNGEMIKKMNNSDSNQESLFKKHFLNKLNEDPLWEDSEKLKLKIYDLIKESSSQTVNVFKAFRNNLGSLLYFVNSNDDAITSNIQFEIFRKLSSGTPIEEIKIKIINDLKNLDKIAIEIAKFNSFMDSQLTQLNELDENNYLKRDFNADLKSFMIKQDYHLVAKLHDLLKIHKDYII